MDVRSRMLAVLGDGSRQGQELVDLVRSEDPALSAAEAWTAMVDLQDDELIEDAVRSRSLADHRPHARWQLTEKGRAAISV